MTAEALFVDLHQRGVQFEATPGGLRYRAPEGVLTPDLRDTLKKHRDDLLMLITPDETLPDTIIIPASCPNDRESLQACLDAQRIKTSAVAL